MIDWARVAELRAEVGEDAFGEVLDLFLEEMADAMARLSADPDPARLRDDLHFVRGAALNLGLKEFCSLCQSMEHGAMTGAEIDLSPLFACYRDAQRILLAGQPAGADIA
ncbi:Hpt domain-containing protein [Rhodovulum bhavnagarense]|uniref:Hpt domain-containing protein n=1 Tax=Rhodovulum bhavnagarense TaxID=992286 RepID=A0A4V2SW62_9RHOB|nr:Hpt domain-containing protein [Rhodovulum bhavnagarense]TCP61116.1 Hpt domain-containing protein [Rhodovulum bhavnagarense]